MKKIILTLAFLVSMISSLTAQWEILNEGFKGSLNTIDFVNENIGWIAYENTLLQTSNAGETWENIPINEVWNIKKIDFINDTVGWVLCKIYSSSESNVVVFKTTTGGHSWLAQLQFESSESYPIELNSIYAIDEKNVFVIFSIYNWQTGDTLKVYKTTNGGNDWVNISNPTGIFFNQMWFLNSNVGLIVGNNNVILSTTNGGNTWARLIINKFDEISNLQYIDTTGYFIARSGAKYFICKTEDFFQSWSILKQHALPIRSFYFINREIAYIILDSTAVWNRILPPLRYNNYVGNIVKSSDGCISWKILQSINYLPFNKIYFSSIKTGFLINDFALIKSTSSEDSWDIQKLSYPFQDVYFINKDKGFLAGSAQYGTHLSIGNLFSTIDGGKTWEINYGLYDIFNSCIFVNDHMGYSLTLDGLYKTTDSGDSWNQTFQFNEAISANDVCFLDEETGFVAGLYGYDTLEASYYRTRIINTTNGGLNWNLSWNPPGVRAYQEFHSIYSLKSSCWAVGDAGLIVKYTPQTGWKKQTQVTDLPLKKVFFSDNNHGWIAGGYLYGNNEFKSIILKTTNSGESWGKNNQLDYLINDMWFMNNLHGWAVGCDTSLNENIFPPSSRGVILETTDGGENWTVVVDNLIGPLYSIYVKDNYAWAVGEYGLVLRTTNAGTTWIDDEDNKVYLTEFKLEQNYPNPFNPATKIRYSIPHVETGHAPSLQRVTLKIYDILGREVATLVNEEQKPGNYEVEFNAVETHSDASLPSGVYFYRLTAGNYSATKKMLLLK